MTFSPSHSVLLAFMRRQWPLFLVESISEIYFIAISHLLSDGKIEKSSVNEEA